MILTNILGLVIIITAIDAAAEPVRFQEQVMVGDHRLEKMGSGELRYLRIIRAYAGALYTLPGTAPQAVLTDTPKHLEVEYFHPLKGKDFGPATYKGLADNLSPEAIDRLRERIDYHNSLYVDVEPGDRYALTYHPGKGTTLSLNGRVRGVIPGADFAAALFSLWLGDNPFDERFKQALLGMEG